MKRSQRSAFFNRMLWSPTTAPRLARAAGGERKESERRPSSSFFFGGASNHRSFCAGLLRIASFLSPSFPLWLKKRSIPLSTRAASHAKQQSAPAEQTREERKRRSDEGQVETHPCRRRPRLLGAPALPRLLLELSIIKEVPQVAVSYRPTEWVSFEN